MSTFVECIFTERKVAVDIKTGIVQEAPILANHTINIASFHLERYHKGGEAVTVVVCVMM